MYRSILWDFDGMLFNSYPHMARAMQLAMREEIQIHSFEETTGRWRYHLQSKENLQK